MSRAQELLDAATPLPWTVYDGPRPGIEGPDGIGDSIVVYGGDFEGDYSGVNTDENAALIVYAVNALPAYEAAREALERLVASIERTGLQVAWTTEARVALARLRDEVPA